MRKIGEFFVGLFGTVIVGTFVYAFIVLTRYFGKGVASLFSLDWVGDSVHLPVAEEFLFGLLIYGVLFLVVLFITLIHEFGKNILEERNDSN